MLRLPRGGRLVRWRFGAALVLLGVGAAGRAQAPPLIPRALLFGAPERSAALLSPDGKQVGWLGPDDAGVPQVWVQPMPTGAPTQLSNQSTNPVARWAWAEDSQAVLFTADAPGQEAAHLFAVDLATRSVRDLTPWQAVRAELLGTSAKVPNEVLVTMNQRDKRFADVHRVNLKSGAVDLDTRNPGDVEAWAFDEALTVRAAVARTLSGGTEVRVRDTVRLPWRTLIKAGPEEELVSLGFALDGKGLFLTTTVGIDTTRVVEKNLKSGTERTLGFHAGSDLREWLFNPWKFALQAVAFEVDGRLKWDPIEPSVTKDLELLAQLSPGQFRITSRDRADALWLVELDGDRLPKRTVLWDRAARKATPLFSHQPGLDAQAFAETRAVTVPARDGTLLPALLTLPPGAPAGPGPLVLQVHGGPWAKDSWGFNPRTQFFANRGYAVLQVNFRGSTGYGKRHLNAGNREWGRRMQDDLADALAWAVQQGVADPRRVGGFGRSYGGYAVLMGAALWPDTLRCVVDGSGPVNLVSLVRNAPSASPGQRAVWDRRVGSAEPAAERARLEQASPLALVDRIRVPVLLAQGEGDSQVKASEVQQFAAALEKAGAPVTWVTYPDEGHALGHPANAIDFYARAEGHFAQCLKGRAEPMPKEGRTAGSSAVVKRLGSAK